MERYIPAGNERKINELPAGIAEFTDRTCAAL